MASGRPLFPGSAIDNQLELIFHTLGTPTESTWPGVTSYKSFEPFKSTVYKPQSLVSSVPRCSFLYYIFFVSYLEYGLDGAYE